MVKFLSNSLFEQTTSVTFVILYVIVLTPFLKRYIVRLAVIIPTGLIILTQIKKIINIKLSNITPMCFKGGDEEWLKISQTRFAFPSGHTAYYTLLLIGSSIYLFRKYYFKAQEKQNKAMKFTALLIGTFSVILALFLSLRVKICGYHSYADVVSAVIYGILYFYAIDALISFIELKYKNRKVKK